jgi:hexosaminidase
MNFKVFISSLIVSIGPVIASPALVPKPQKMSVQSGHFTLKPKQVISYTGCKSEAQLFAQAIAKPTGIQIKLVESKDASIRFVVDPTLEISKEGYTLKVTSKKIVLKAKTAAGIFYGTQSLLQLLPVTIYADKTSRANRDIPAVTIDDAPAYSWRGIMLDVSRYFMDLEYVKHYIDIMALHKLNVLHLHLIDDAGWRIEIKKYPKLTTVGGWRGEGRDRRNGGFYTKKQLKEMVKYAADRHIMIVPEIELPAHTLSALAAYPYLGCRQIAHKVPERHFISRDLYCAGRKTTYQFLRDVMKEVFEIFPSEYIHVGGDEAKYDQWRKCKYCQAKMKKEGYTTEKQLQGYMTRFFENLCHKNNRKIIGWDEILKCDVSKSAGLMVWHNTKHAYEGAKKGYPVVAAYVRHAYFDTPESRLPGEIIGTGWTPPVTLRKSYEWDPRPEGLTDQEAKNILGGHACLWNDQFLHKKILRDEPGKGDSKSETYVDMLTLPRIAGLAETCWTKKENKDYDDFINRMQTHLLRYELQGWSFRLPLPRLTYQSKAGKIEVTATPSIKHGKIYYTTNGETPTTSSNIYTQSVIVNQASDFQAIMVSPMGRNSLVACKTKVDKTYIKYGKKIGKWSRGKIAAKKATAKTWNATGLINKNDSYNITFLYTSGRMRLDIDWIEILRNDQVIQRITAHKYTTKNRPATYNVKINSYETGASFKIRAGIYGDKGKDSNGLVFIKKGR